MKLNWKTGGFISLLAVGVTGWANAQVYTGTKIEKGGGLDNYHLSMGNYFNVSEKVILSCAKKNVLEEEIPVVLLMAQKAGVAPGVVAGLHAGGMSWIKVAQHYKLKPRIFYVPTMEKVNKAPYKKIYEYYQGRKGRIQLSDDDFVNLVNLRFMSDHFGHDPREIILMRNKGNTFQDINDTFRQEKEDMYWDAEDSTLEVRDSKGQPDPRKGDRNSLNPAERKKNQ